MKRRFALGLLLLLGILGPLATRSDAAPTVKRQWVFDGRPVDVFVPSGPPQAVVVLLHGFELTSEDVEKSSQLIGPGVREGWLIVVPNGIDGSWNAGLCCGTATHDGIDDVGYLANLVTAVRAERHIARDVPTVMGGFSDGAMMTEEFLCRRPGVVDGAILMAGNLQDPACTSAHARDILEIAGQTDETVPAAGLAHSNFLGTRLLPNRATVNAARHGLRCRTTRAEVGRPAHKGYGVLEAACGRETFTALTEAGGHAWLRGTAGTPSATTPLILSLVYHLERGHAGR